MMIMTGTMDSQTGKLCTLIIISFSQEYSNYGQKYQAIQLEPQTFLAYRPWDEHTSNTSFVDPAQAECKKIKLGVPGRWG